MSVTIHVPKELLEPELADGKPNPFRDPLITFALKQAYRRGGHAGYAIVDEQDELPYSLLLQLAAAGCEIVGFPIWIELDAIEYQMDVPEYMPYATDSMGTPYKWRDWHDESHAHHMIKPKYYVPGNSMTGRELNGSVINRLRADGYEIKTKRQFQDILNGEGN